jgi:hypothetical protein
MEVAYETKALYFARLAEQAERNDWTESSWETEDSSSTIATPIAVAADVFYHTMKTDASHCLGDVVPDRKMSEFRADVAQKLWDLLLEFPDAAIAGLRWDSLVMAFEELHGESLDHTDLGYPSKLAAAEELVPDARVWLPMPCSAGASSSEAASLCPLVAIPEKVALAPRPGFAASWPSLYRSLCAVVQRFGFIEEASISNGYQEGGSSSNARRSLLVSKLRPLLENIDGADETPEIAAARDILLSQLRPVSKSRPSSGVHDENGLSFRDESGAFGKLKKIGHVVKAVLHWRERYGIVRSTREGSGADQATEDDLSNRAALDSALAPQLELVFSREYNNLVVQLFDKSPETVCAPPDRPCGTVLPENSHVQADASRHPPASTATIHRGGDCAENPFKWTPVLSEMPSPAKPQSLVIPAAREAGGRLSLSDASTRAPSPIAPNMTRARSLTRGDRDASIDGGEGRCRSEPPQSREVFGGVFDDPFEPPPEENRWAGPPLPLTSLGMSSFWPERSPLSASHSGASSTRTCSNPGGGSTPLLHGTTDVQVRRSSRSRERQGGCLASGPAPDVHMSVNEARPRGRNLEPRFASSFRAELRDPRSQSEPPLPRAVDIFDDPFEPPPQEEHWSHRHSTRTSLSGSASDCTGDTGDLVTLTGWLGLMCIISQQQQSA